jgi:predicted amidohydrolase
VICYDLRFPELFRRLSIGESADVILHPVAYPFDFTFPSYHSFVAVRALENLVYMVSLNRSAPASEEGIRSDVNWVRSIFCPPDWPQENSIEIFNDGEEFRPLTIERDALNRARLNYPFMEDRREDYFDLGKI